jgi:hypothetical protein
LANIPAWAKRLIEKHYGACGLGEEALKLVERLLARMSLELGKSEEFWREELENPTSKINKLDLLYGAIMYAVNKAKASSQRSERDVCEYLKLSIEEGWIGNYLIGYEKAMLSEYYKRRNCT